MPSILYEKPAQGYATLTIKGDHSGRPLTLEVTPRIYTGKRRCKPCRYYTT